MFFCKNTAIDFMKKPKAHFVLWVIQINILWNYLTIIRLIFETFLFPNLTK